MGGHYPSPGYVQARHYPSTHGYGYGYKHYPSTHILSPGYVQALSKHTYSKSWVWVSTIQAHIF